MMPSPTPSPIDIDQLINIVSGAITVAQGLPGIVGAIFVGLIGLTIAALLIAKYFTDRGAREKAAYEAQLAVEQTLADNLSRMQLDATEAFISNMDITYAQDYKYFTESIKAGTFTAIYAKVAPQFRVAISNFVYDSSITPEDRAARIIMLVQPSGATATL